METQLILYFLPIEGLPASKVMFISTNIKLSTSFILFKDNGGRSVNLLSIY